MKWYSLFSRLFALMLLHVAVPQTGTAQWMPSYNGAQLQGNTPMVWNVSVVNSQVVWASMTRNYASGTSNVFFRTTNGGSTWTHKTVTGANPSAVFVNLHALNADTAWATLWRWPDLYPEACWIYKTSDGGNTWEEKKLPFAAELTAVVSIHFFNDAEGFAYAMAKDTAEWYIKCYYTQDGGEIWQLAAVPEVFGEEFFLDWGNTHYSVVGDTAWFGAARSKIYRTTDKGMTWDTLHIPYFHSRTTNSVSFRDARNGIAATMLSDSLGGIYAYVEGFRTHDGGLSWERLPITDSSSLNRVFRMLGLAVIPGSGGAYIAYGYRQAGLVYQQWLSLDEGQTWNLIPGPYSRIRCMQFISPANGWGGGWKYDVSNTVIPAIVKWSGPAILDSKEAQLPEVPIELAPNPAADYLRVTAAAEPGEIFQVLLTDLAGNLLRQAEIQGGAPATLDLHTLSAGVYLVNVFNEKAATVRTVIKLKTPY
ncbi:MAG: T9SS type A sorting domain-containing protein [Saprospirales bacterium]|nr:T9SS type A sorting domain-containing protein [Saprospirales bacterium]